MGSPVTIIRGGRVFDGEHLTTATTVAMSGDHIADVPTEAAESATSVDLGDVTLLPGLVDCHQHLCFDGVGELHDQVRDLDDEALATHAHESALRAVRGGVTTVRDLGDRSYVTLGLRGAAGLPRILASGPPIARDRAVTAGTSAASAAASATSGERSTSGPIVDATSSR